MVQRLEGNWNNPNEIGTGVAHNFECGHCGSTAGPSRGYNFAPTASVHEAILLICPVCNRPSFLASGLGEQTPGPLPGQAVDGIDDVDVAALYTEAQRAISVGAPSAAVLVSRKILMHLAVSNGAKENQGFTYYAQFLSDEGVVGKPFADVLEHIKDQGNKENHELEVRSQEDAALILKLVEFLLRSVYELPGMIVGSEGESQ